MTSIYKCSDCGHHTDSPHVIDEDEIRETMADASYDELMEAMESAGAETCPECFSPEIELIDVLD